MEQKKIDRINELAKLAKERELTDEEKVLMDQITGSFEKTVLSGRDFSIREIHVAEPQE